MSQTLYGNFAVAFFNLYTNGLTIQVSLVILSVPGIVAAKRLFLDASEYLLVRVAGVEPGRATFHAFGLVFPPHRLLWFESPMVDADGCCCHCLIPVLRKDSAFRVGCCLKPNAVIIRPNGVCAAIYGPPLVTHTAQPNETGRWWDAGEHRSTSTQMRLSIQVLLRPPMLRKP